MRGIVVRLLVWSLVATLLLPVVVGVVIGLAALLDAVGDAAAAVACQRVALVAGVLWIVAIITTSVCGGVVTLDTIGREQGHRPPDDPIR